MLVMKEMISVAELIQEIPGIGSEDMGTLLNTGSFKYYCVMRDHIRDGTCPFCQIDTELNKVLYENEHWRIWENPVAKKDPAVERHLVIPNKKHIVDPGEVPNEHGKSLFDIWQWASREFEIPGGALIMRFGEVKRNAGSIRHLHANIKVPTGKKKLMETLAKDEDDILRKGPVMLVMEEMYRLKIKGSENPFEELSEEKKELVKDRM